MSAIRTGRLSAALVLLGGLGLHAAPSAPAAADSDAAVCTISGGGAFSGDLTQTPAQRNYTFALTWTCTGVGDEAGTWSINFIGTSPAETCASGSAVGTATGSVEGEGPSSATVSMNQSGTRFTFSGVITTASETHHVNAHVTLSAPTCPIPGNTQFPASGTGTLADA